jgi:hypothetical protein
MLTDGGPASKNDHCRGVIFGTEFPPFDRLLRVYHWRLACRGSRIARSGPAHCADCSALDHHRARDSQIWLEQVGGAAVLLLLATSNDPNMVISPWLGANRFRNFFNDRNRNDRDRWAGLDYRNCYIGTHREWCWRMASSRHGIAGRGPTSSGTSIEPSPRHCPSLTICR